MSNHPVRVALDPSRFTAAEGLIASSGALSATAFRFPSGVAGLRVENGAGSVILLPFQGQQVWDAQFFGRRLTMRSRFEAPQPTRDYLRTYGALFIHCGGTAMGNPGPGDTHPVHGELPNLPYAEAQLVFDSDAEGAYVELTGTGRDTEAFHHDFVSRPRVRVRERASSIEVGVDVCNGSATPMPLLYLGHINFRPIDGAVLFDTVRDDRRDVSIRPVPLAPDAPEPVRRYHAALTADPGSHRVLVAGTPVQPELVLTMRAAAGADGWAHALQRHPDGDGDFVSYRPEDLPYAVRWLTRGLDEDALGLLLPATSPPDGLGAATRNGQIKWLAPGASFRTEMRFGTLDASAAAGLQAHIASIRDR